ncbi:MAG TPA: hypothetical protein VME68_16870 [Acidobacteriaceae bacterium]|nr:hypothetical protein [Acidobacteriaceae bacterium]
MKFTIKSIFPPIDFGWNHVRARCGLTPCHSKLLMRPSPQSRVGIQVGGTWYCSVDCFVTASREPLAALCAGRIVEMPRTPRLSLGLAMLSKGLVTEAELRAATDRADRTGEDLEVVLLQLELASEKQIAAGRAAQWGAPVLGSEMAGHTVTAGVPQSLLRAHGAVPLHYAAPSKRLVLGFVHRVEHSLLQSIEQAAGCRTEACFVTSSEFEEQAARVMAPADYEEVVVTEPESPAHMARTLGYHAVEAAAREVRLVRCNSWIWGRIEGKRQTIDVVFALRHGARSASSQVFHETVQSRGWN